MSNSSTSGEVLGNLSVLANRKAISGISCPSFSFRVFPPENSPFQYSESKKIIRTSPVFLSILISLKFCFAKQMLAGFWADIYLILYLHNYKYLYKFHL